MIVLPLIYFSILFIVFYYRNKCWGGDLAGTLVLCAISLCAIMIDVNEVYGDYGVNKKSYNLLTLILFCFQWTIALLPLHALSAKKVVGMVELKKKPLYVLCLLMFLSSIYMVYLSMDDIKQALIMDLSDVRDMHYQNLNMGSEKGSNYFSLLPQIITAAPFPTLAIAFWFYMNSFVKGHHLIKTAVLLSSIVQAAISIAMAGRAAMIYWTFDFFIVSSFLFKYMSKTVKRVLVIVIIVLGTTLATMFIAITVARFDKVEKARSPLESLYAYGGQHINNFSIMMIEGGNTTLQIDREFPFISKFFFNKQFDLNDHYNVTAKTVKAQVNVFDTFGAEVYLDMGWPAYIFILMVLCFVAWFYKHRWNEISFDRLLIMGVTIAFFTRSLFAWPFTSRYTSMAIALIVFLKFFFKYKFRI